MSFTPNANQHAQLRGHLDRLAGRADRVLKKRLLKVQLKELCNQTLKLFFVFPLLLVLANVIRLLAGGESWHMGFWAYLLLSLLLAIGFLCLRLGWIYARASVARASSLALYDQALNNAGVLVTADEFLDQPHCTGFMSAAIDAAVQPAESALQSELRPGLSAGRWQLSRWNLLTVPTGILATFVAVWIGGFQFAVAEGQGDRDSSLAAVSGGSGKPGFAQGIVEDRDDAGQEAGGEDPAADENSRDGAENAASAGSHSKQWTRAGLEGESMSAGDSGQGGQQTGGTPTGPGSQPQGPAAAGQQKNVAEHAMPRARANGETDQASGHDAGKNSSQADNKPAVEQGKGGSSSSGDQGSGGDGDEYDPDPSAADSNAEASGSESSGEQQSGGEQGGQSEQADSHQQGGEAGQGEQGEAVGGGEPQQAGEAEKEGKVQAQGGEPGGSGPDSGQGEGEGAGATSEDEIKKNRGVPSAILGLPQRERLQGPLAEGPDHKTQQQSMPSEQSVPALAAEQRQARSEMIGELQKSRVNAWSRSLVKNYFLDLRQKSNRQTVNQENGSTEREDDKQ